MGSITCFQCWEDLEGQILRDNGLAKLTNGDNRRLSKVDGKAENSRAEQGYLYYTTRKIEFEFDDDKGNTRKCTIRKFFLNNGANGPAVDTIGVQGWLRHDWLYTTHADDSGQFITRELADKVLELKHRVAAVRLFGQEAWERAGARGPQFLHIPANSERTESVHALGNH